MQHHDLCNNHDTIFTLISSLPHAGATPYQKSVKMAMLLFSLPTTLGLFAGNYQYGTVIRGSNHIIFSKPCQEGQYLALDYFLVLYVYVNLHSKLADSLQQTPTQKLYSCISITLQLS